MGAALSLFLEGVQLLTLTNFVYSCWRRGKIHEEGRYVVTVNTVSLAWMRRVNVVTVNCEFVRETVWYSYSYVLISANG